MNSGIILLEYITISLFSLIFRTSGSTFEVSSLLVDVLKSQNKVMDSTGVLVTAGLTALSASISYNINTHIPKPYMDEIFHIPQAQKYCQGDFFLVSNLQNSKARILKKKNFCFSGMTKLRPYQAFTLSLLAFWIHCQNGVINGCVQLPICGWSTSGS